MSSQRKGLGGADAGVDLTPLGDELARLLARQHLPVTRIVAVTTIASPVADRAAFRVVLADGTSIKARRCKSAAAVTEQQRLLRASGERGFPAILAAEGRSMLLAWVDGEGFDAHPREALAYERSGELLGRLQTESPAARSKAPTADTDWRARILDWTRRLVDADRIDAGLARRVTSLLDATAPVSVESGPVHLDFSAANLILDRDGYPVAIDNETVSTGPLDYDLAISEQRWPMQSWQRAAFERGYERHRDLAGYRRARSFWHLAYLTRRAALKSRRPGNAEAGALEALRGLLDETREVDRAAVRDPDGGASRSRPSSSGS